MFARRGTKKETPSGKPLGVCRVLPVLGEAKDFRRSQLRKSRTVHDAIVEFFLTWAEEKSKSETWRKTEVAFFVGRGA
jgi:hypothetical protein